MIYKSLIQYDIDRKMRERRVQLEKANEKNPSGKEASAKIDEKELLADAFVSSLTGKSSMLIK